MARTDLDLVPNEPLREALAEARRWKSVSYIAAEAGFKRGRASGRGDGARLKRALGMLPSYKAGYAPRIQTHVTYDTALRIARAMGLDPVDVGL